MAPIDFTNNDQNTMRGVIWGYTDTLNISIRIEDNPWNVIIFTRNLVGTEQGCIYRKKNA